MFEQFTNQARQVVVRAQAETRSMQHTYLGPEHLMLAVLSQPDAPGAATLTRLGVTAEAYRREVEQLPGTPDLSTADADALRGLGIDLNEVKRKVEETFGEGALDPPRRRRRSSWLPWRRGEECDEPAGRIRFTPRAKHTLEYALRQALARKDRHIGTEHIVLGLLAFKDSTAAELLGHLGVDPATARREILADLDKAA
jgi:ATP-dependent Clp protease ATP-binding subunit ClpA